MGKFYTRKIAAKNIKVERRQSSNDGEAIQRFFEQQQQVLLAQTKIIALDGGAVTVPEEELYRMVETFCRHGKGAQCWQSLFKECIEPLTTKCLENIEAISQAGLKSITAAFLDEYDMWRSRILKLQLIYFYLDRSFLLQSGNGGATFSGDVRISSETGFTQLLASGWRQISLLSSPIWFVELLIRHCCFSSARMWFESSVESPVSNISALSKRWRCRVGSTSSCRLKSGRL